MSIAALDNFPWPQPPGTHEKPVWRDNGFIVGGENWRILAFDTADSHWTPELTTLHQEEAGADHPIDRASRRLAVDSLVRFVVTGKPIVLDVGCSSGYVLKDIQKALPNAALIGSDYISAPLTELAARMPDLPILRFDLRRCPLPDACVDAVTALNVLEHIDHHQEALQHIYRILRPNGIAHIEVPAGPALFDIYDKHLMHHRRYRLHDLIDMARKTGFQIVKATHLGCLVYPAFWFVKKRNRRRFSDGQLGKSIDQVRTHIRTTRRSGVMEILMRIEQALSRAIMFPVGIRCVLVARKPL